MSLPWRWTLARAARSEGGDMCRRTTGFTSSLGRSAGGVVFVLLLLSSSTGWPYNPPERLPDIAGPGLSIPPQSHTPTRPDEIIDVAAASCGCDCWYRQVVPEGLDLEHEAG